MMVSPLNFYFSEIKSFNFMGSNLFLICKDVHIKYKILIVAKIILSELIILMIEIMISNVFYWIEKQPDCYFKEIILSLPYSLKEEI